MSKEKIGVKELMSSIHGPAQFSTLFWLNTNILALQIPS